MNMQIIEILLAALITIISSTSELSVKTEDKRIFKKLTFLGWIVILLSIGLIGINLKSQFEKEYEKEKITASQISSRILIKAYSKARIDSIANALPQNLYPEMAKIGTDEIILIYEKRTPRPGRAKSGDSWFLDLYSKDDIKLSDFRQDSKDVESINGEVFHLKLETLNKVLCEFPRIKTQLFLKIRDNYELMDWVDCNERIQIEINGIE